MADESARAHETVYVSGGRRGLEIAIAPADLVALTRAETRPLARAGSSFCLGSFRPPVWWRCARWLVRARGV
jgi:hypothetical protein